MQYKKILYTFLGILISICFTLLFLELVLNFFPVNEGLRSQAVNEKDPIFKFEANREAIFSKHWNFDIKNKVRVNNYGFVNNNDYYNTNKLPLLSIIGDSYVEALMVPFEKTISGLLQNEVSNKRVYSFAASGAGLSQHLIWAKYAKEEFKSDYYIFVIIANDFMESLSKYGSSPGFHRFKINPDTSWTMELSTYTPSNLRKVLRRSKLAMYLITNLKVHSIFNFELRLGKEDQRRTYVSNFDADVSDIFWEEAKLVTDIYLDNMNSFTGQENNKILFVLDGIRPNLYDKVSSIDITNSFWYKIREYFMYKANAQGFEFIDMQKDFYQEYKKNKEFFEFKTDTHWNHTGHKAVTKSILQSNTWKRFSLD